MKRAPVTSRRRLFSDQAGPLSATGGPFVWLVAATSEATGAESIPRPGLFCVGRGGCMMPPWVSLVVCGTWLVEVKVKEACDAHSDRRPSGVPDRAGAVPRPDRGVRGLA